MKTRSATSATLLLLLSACADDPAKGGFLDGIEGLATGKYEQRSEAKLASLHREEDRYERELVFKDALDTAIRSHHNKIGSLETQAGDIEQEISVLQAEVIRVQAEQAQKSEQLDEAIRQMTIMANDIDALRDANSTNSPADAMEAKQVY